MFHPIKIDPFAKLLFRLVDDFLVISAPLEEVSLALRESLEPYVRPVCIHSSLCPFQVSVTSHGE